MFIPFQRIHLTAWITGMMLSWIALAVRSNSSENLLMNRYEGDRVFIPCLNSPSETIFMWKINESIYLVDKLPEKLQIFRNGIFVHYITLNITGVFTCLTDKMEFISTIQLLVHKRDLTDAASGESGSTFFGEPEEFITTDSELHLDVIRSDTVFIPCVAAFEPQDPEVTVWGIDGSLYPLMELPKYHIYKQSGLVAYNISEKNSGRIYKCYSIQDNKIQNLYTVHLHLSELQSENALSSVYFNNRKEILQLVSSGVDLSHLEPYYNFRYRIINSTQSTDYCRPGNVTFTMNVTDGVQSLWSNDTNVYLPNFSPPRKVFEERDAYAEAYGTDRSGQVCTQVQYGIRVELNGSLIKIDSDDCVSDGSDICCVSKGGQGCFILPENLDGLVVIWPRSPHSEIDCACAVFYPFHGARFEDCYCLKIHLTVYNVTLIDRRLCWNNLVESKNDTKVVFVRDMYNNNFQRNFLSETRFIIKGPGPFLPTFTQDSYSTVCINSMNYESNLVLATTVIVHDNTNDIILSNEIPSNDFCLDLKAFPQSCAPFTLYATAHGLCSKSPTTMFNSAGIRSTNEISNCDCLKDKVSINKSSTVAGSNSITLSFEVSCLRFTEYYNVTNLFLEVVEEHCTENCTDTNTSFSIQCDQNLKSVTISALKEFTSYSWSVVWISPFNSSVVCEITQNDVFKTDLKTWKYTLIGSVPLLLLIILLLTIICRIRYKRKKKFSIDYQHIRQKNEYAEPTPLDKSNTCT